MSSAGPAGPVSPHRLFKDILQGSGIYLFGSIAQRFAGVLMIPITARFLTTAEFGIADLLEQSTSVLSLLLGTRFGSALGYFFFETDSAESRRSIVVTSILGAGLLGLLATLICRPLSMPLSRLVFGNPSAGRYFEILFLLLPASFIAEAAYSLLRVENRPVAYTLMSFLRLGLQVAGIIVFVAVLKLHVMGIVYTSCVAGVLVAAIMAVHCLGRFRSRFDFGIFIRMMRYAVPMGLAGIAIFFVNVGDRFILPHYRPLSELGIYVLAYRIGMLPGFFYASFHTYWSAQIFSIMRRDDADSVFARAFTYVMLGLSFSAVALIVCTPAALRIMVAPAFRGAGGVVPIIVAAYSIRSAGDFLRCIFLVEGRPGYDAVCSWMGAAVCGAGYLLLIPKFGMWGAAYATVAAFALTGAFSMIWTYRLRPYRVEAARLIKIGAACAVPIALYYAIRGPALTVLVGTAVLSLASFPLVLWILRFPTPGEWKTVLNRTAGLRQNRLGKSPPS